MQYIKSLHCALTIQAPKDAKGKQPASPAGEAEQHYGRQYLLLQYIQYGRRGMSTHLLPIKSDCLSGGKRQHGVVQTELLNMLNTKCQ